MPARVERDSEDLCCLVQGAREEWQHAHSYFDWVTEPGLIDYAIYWSLAAQSRYLYLLQLAKKSGITLSWDEVFRFSLAGEGKRSNNPG
ncbi:MAG TPA: YaaL family protein [Firmicutes bacterium]|nr:YaaL family protein [Bacillota bacterium]